MVDKTDFFLIRLNSDAENWANAGIGFADLICYCKNKKNMLNFLMAFAGLDIGFNEKRE